MRQGRGLRHGLRPRHAYGCYCWRCVQRRADWSGYGPVWDPFILVLGLVGLICFWGFITWLFLLL